MTTAVAEQHAAEAATFCATVQDPELPLCAARAAAQIDQLIRGEVPAQHASQVTGDSIDGFMRLLENMNLGGGNGVRSFMDPASSRIFVLALQEAHWAQSIKSYQELGGVLLQILDMLGKARQPGKGEKLEQLRDFFIYLSDFAAAERRAYISRPKQPYRRYR